MTYKVLTCFSKHMRAEKRRLFKSGVASFPLFGLLFLLWSCGSKNPVETEEVGSIFVYSNISGAAIELDGDSTGEETPHTFKNIKVGSHTVSVKMEGYNSTPEFKTVEVKEGKLDTVEFTLTLITEVGAIWVDSDPPGAQIYLDQVNTQKTTPDKLDSVSVGKHEVSVKMKGYRASPDTVEVVKDSSIEVFFALERLGAIVVHSDPSEAEIIMDHVSTGMTTTDTIFDMIPESSYVVSVFKEEYSNDDPAKRVVDVDSGETIEVTFHLNHASSVGPDSAGQLAPDFELKDDRGDSIKLYNYRGCVVIVMFWGTSCPICMSELPFLQELYEQYSIDDSLMIFAVNYENDLATIQLEKAANDLEYPLLVGKESQMLEDYKLGEKEGTPITIIIDRSGLIYSWVLGYRPGIEEIVIRTALSELLGH